jgi:hypothetical protein
MKRNRDKARLVGEWLAFAKENLLFAKAGMKEEFAPYHTISQSPMLQVLTSRHYHTLRHHRSSG